MIWANLLDNLRLLQLKWCNNLLPWINKSKQSKGKELLRIVEIRASANAVSEAYTITTVNFFLENVAVEEFEDVPDVESGFHLASS